MFYKISRLLILFFLTSTLHSASLKAKLDKTTIYLGESAQLTLIFSYGDNVEDYEIIKPHFTDISVTELSSKDHKGEDGLYVEEISYSLKPLKDGNFTLSSLEVALETLSQEYKQFNNRSKYTKKFTLQANRLNLRVKRLPNNISVMGEYIIKARVDKTRVKAGEIVTLTISLYGDGNIENLDALKPQIENATSYLCYTTKSRQKHLQTKVYEIISDKPYTIPSLELSFFNKETSQVKKSTSKAISIKIEGYKGVKTVEDKSIQSSQEYIFFLLGVLSTLLLFFIYRVLKSHKSKPAQKLLKELHSCKEKEKFYKKVVVFLGKERLLNSLIYQLEEEHLSNFKVIKKKIIKRLRELRLNERDDLFFTTQDSI